LNLMLKCLEGEAGTNLKLSVERILPDLSDNIKCGNSLIGSDFHNGLFDAEENKKINPFDWISEFPDIMSKGGFDVVIGNPPYIRMEEFKEIKNYLSKNYEAHSDRADIYYYFVEKASHLLKEGGRLGFILSNTFARSRAGESLRSVISRKLRVRNIVEFGDFTPFAGATVYPIILIAENNKSKTSDKIEFILQDSNPIHFTSSSFKTLRKLDVSSFTEKAWIFDADESTSLRAKLFENNPSLKRKYGQVMMGIKSGLNEAFIINDDLAKTLTKNNVNTKKILKPYLGGKNIDTWVYNWDKDWLIYFKRGMDLNTFPDIKTHLLQYKSNLSKRAGTQNWYELQQSQEAYSPLLDKSKIIFPDISRYPKFCLDDAGMYFSNTVYFINSDSKYLLALLNSKLLWFVVKGLSNALRGGLWRFRLFSGHIEKLPIFEIDSNNKRDKEIHDKLISLVDRMLTLNKDLPQSKTPQEKIQTERQIAATDREIDKLVYELYGLTEEEIAIIEN
ncbi:MAG: TaqI-like C-terminal specificity domain-containing protein, partial [Ignavibacteriota bacterium]